MEPVGNDWVVLFSDVQNAYHVERRSEYERLGEATGNWQVVATATSWSEAISIVDDRTQQKLDKVQP